MGKGMPVEGHRQSCYTAVPSGREHEEELVSVALRKKGGGESQT